MVLICFRMDCFIKELLYVGIALCKDLFRQGFV